MIQLLAFRCRKPIACSLLTLFFLSFVSPLYSMYASLERENRFRIESIRRANAVSVHVGGRPRVGPVFGKETTPAKTLITPRREGKAPLSNRASAAVRKKFIGGPTQPEMSSFKAAGTDNMVNLFTGDFSYNIPLLDVGGYPVNIFYSGGISMEQEASWVGLGWNINPGTVNRNMRGVPDDFNGEDVLTQTQSVKPNITWGFRLGADMEFSGVKAFENFTGSLGLNLGMSFNNYLGPALDFGIKGGLGVKLASKTGSEKSADTTFGLKLNAGFEANASSRYGFTFSPNISLTAVNFTRIKGLTTGVGVGTSYNSRTGMKQLQLNEQMAFNFATAKYYTKGSELWAFSGSSSMGAGILSASISFAKPSYIPAIRMPLTNESYSAHVQLGAGIFGGYVSGELEAYQQKSYVGYSDIVQRKPLVGYLYNQLAVTNLNAVMDFTRVNDNEVTPHTPIISAPQYTYDVFAIQGEGTGGTIRAYRNDYGHVRDNNTRSRDKSLSLGADIGPPGHFGANFNTVKTPSVIGDWEQGNKLNSVLRFQEANETWENVYFRNPGETSVLHDQQFNKIGGTDLVRFKLGGSGSSPTVEPILERFSKSGSILGTTNITTPDPAERKKRSQVINFLTAEEAARAGLDKVIKSYDGQTILDGSRNLIYTPIDRVDLVSNIRRKHHISQINVTEADGKRYVYGIPVYNIKQKDFSFSVGNEESPTEKGKVTIGLTEPGINSPHLPGSSTTKRDGFLQITETPAYAHSFLLSGLLSPDYVDVTGDGITEDDLGDAVKFNYSRMANPHKWRTPLTPDAKASFNPGTRTEKRDDKGMISYGERESWYLHSLESKTMIAVFLLGDRKDGKGSSDEVSGINTGDQSLKRLNRIDLYNKADLKKNGIAGAKPVKSVHFLYSYSLCANTPGNSGAAEVVNGQDVNLNKGKLTLDRIYFTFNGQNRAVKNQYVFAYGAPTPGTENPSYAFNASDRWGTYKPASMNPGGLENSDFPYSIQKNVAPTADSIKANVGAWSLKKILLPSGGQLEVEYESDDYAFVQNKRATSMLEIAGFGRDGVASSNRLYDVFSNNSIDNDKVFINVPEACTTQTQVFQKYLQGITQLAFKLAVVMPKGTPEYITMYATIADYGFVPHTSTIWVRLNKVDGSGPLAVSALEFLREQLPGQAYSPGYDVSESSGLKQVANLLTGMFAAFGEFLKDPGRKFREKGYAQTVILNQSFVRLIETDGYKYGGGHRVKKVRLKDNWKAMTGQYTSEYGQEYDYTTTEIYNGSTRTISSGVASYEPSIGGEENPFQTIVQVANKLPLGPTSFGAIEMPVMDAFFPAPVVGYSKVSVRSVKRGDIPAGKKSRSGIGRQVTEFYTAKDFPVYYSHTSFDPSVDKQLHQSSFGAFFYKYAFDSRALSQGFLIETNDMHGKMRSQASYADNDDKTRINYTEHFYRNTGSKGLGEKFDFAHNAAGGEIRAGNMGIDIELMTDTRSFSVSSTSLEIQGQVDLFPVFFPFWLPFIWPVAGDTENNYRAVTTTKVISYHSILDSMVVIDKGSQVSTKNLVYDSETGQMLVNRTNNEFDLPVYSTKYPAYWAYSGMGPAYRNIDAVLREVDFKDGVITSITAENVRKMFESGDELYLLNQGDIPADNCSARLVSPNSVVLWAFDKNKNSQSLTNPAADFVFMDAEGKLYTKDNVTLRIIRSGKRNMLQSQVAGVTSMLSPIMETTTRKLMINSSSKTVSGTAMEYKEKWQTDNDAIGKFSLVYNSSTCTYTEVPDCDGYLEKRINPYRKGLIGNFRSHRSMLFYGDRTEANPAVPTNLPQNGFLNNFKLYWDFNTANNLIPDETNPKWTWNSQITRMNAKGRELETKDALNIYTAAQYGFNKSLPTTITNNARYDEMFSEGFEDKGYRESISNAIVNSCGKLHMSFDGLANTRLVNTTDTTFKAHSGRFVLGVNGNSTASKSLAVTGNVVDSFTMKLYADTTKELNDPGGKWNGLFFCQTPQACNYFEPRYLLSQIDFNTFIQDTNILGGGLSWPTYNNLGASLSFAQYGFPLNDCYATFLIHPGATEQFFNVSQTGVFNLQVGQRDVYQSQANPTHPSYYTQKVLIYTADGSNTLIASFNGPSTIVRPAGNVYTTEAINNYSVSLCKGSYKIHMLVYQIRRNYDCYESGNAFYSFTQSMTSYASLNTQNGCIYTKPMAATDSMLNPTFTIPSNKKMLFSAWVRETCGNPTNGTPCTATTFNNNKVVLQFNDGSSQPVEIRPAGPIIEGWQRIEGEFTAPAGASTMNLNLVNSSGSMIFYDDIRIHPFNANMKTYVYDPVNLRLVAEQDANNYTSFYEYDEEGTLIRTKAETREGIKTIRETRSAKQKNITTLQ